MKARLVRLALTVATLSMLVAVVGAIQKWG